MSRSQRRVIPLVALSAVAFAAIVMAQTTRKPSAASSIQANTDRRESPAIDLATAPAERKPLAFYTGGVRGDLFTSPSAAKPETATKVVMKAPALPVPAPAVVNPFSDYAYTGTVTAGGQLMALVENTKTKEGQYLKAGDSFLGGTVSEINERTMSVKLVSGSQMLSKSDDFKLVPLDKSAAYLQPGAAGQPAAPNQPGGAGTPGMANGAPAALHGAMPDMPANMAARLQSRMQNMTEEQRAAVMNRWMNRRFERGNSGGRRGGFGG